MIRFPAYAVVAVVLLRLLCGWHFYNEGVKKLDPSFSSAGFLRGAKGPFAPMFKKIASGPYGAYELLAVPVEIGSRPAEEQAASDAWVVSMNKLVAGNKVALKKKKPLKPYPSEVPAEAPSAAWFESIRAGWDDGLERLGRLGGADVTEIREANLRELAFYLWSQTDKIEELQHEVWRLEKMKEEAGDSPAPFELKLIADKDREVWTSVRPLIAGLQRVEANFVEQVAEANEGAVSEKRVASSLEERSLLAWSDTLVTAVVLGGGVLVFLGLATRLAAVACAGFLLSLIMTQPPWVVGADLGAFFTWAVELAAFLVLAAVGAGKWAGVDGVLHLMRVRFGDLSPKYEALRK